LPSVPTSAIGPDSNAPTAQPARPALGWEQDPEGAEREWLETQRRLIKEVEDAHRAGRRVDTLTERLYHAYRRLANQTGMA
jgi:hypothetical protein